MIYDSVASAGTGGSNNDHDQDADGIDGGVDADDDNVIDKGHVSQASGLVHATFLVVVSSLETDSMHQ